MSVVYPDVNSLWDALTADMVGMGTIGRALARAVFSPYDYNGSLATGAYFTAPAKTIVMTAELQVIDKLQIRGQYGVQQIASGGQSGFIGATYCDGSDIRYKNTDAGAQFLNLSGLTMG